LLLATRALVTPRLRLLNISGAPVASYYPEPYYTQKGERAENNGFQGPIVDGGSMSRQCRQGGRLPTIQQGALGVGRPPPPTPLTLRTATIDDYSEGGGHSGIGRTRGYKGS
jgi:hypothetical protein